MLLRVYILSIIINSSLLISNIFLFLTATSGYIISYYISKKEKRVRNFDFRLSSPISFRFIAFYIPLFSALFVIANIVNKHFGILASQILAIIVGLMDVSSLAAIFSTLAPENVKILLLILTSSNLIGNSLIVLRNNKKMFLMSFRYSLLLILFERLFLYSHLEF